MFDTALQVGCIRAIGLTVSELEQSIEFYTQAFGFTVLAQEPLTFESFPVLSATLRLGDEHLKLMQFLDCESRPIPKDSQSSDLWFQHFAIVVSDMDRAYGHLRSFQTEAISAEPQTLLLNNPEAAGVRAFKFKDPDGHNLELIWFPPDKRQAKWNSAERLFLGIDHSAIAVVNTERSVAFYRDLLGMKVESSSLHEGAEQAILDSLPEAKVQVTGLRPNGGGFGVEFLDYWIPSAGRSFPDDWRICDLSQVHLELVIPGLEHPRLIRDPDGHVLRLIAE
jgi:catechol 2,3-dioxygenase-like lactoylglutathione lyase family enzyme